MSAIPTPRVGFSQGYTLGENNWNLGYDENWQLLDRIVSSDFGIFSIASRVLVLLGGVISSTTGVTTAAGATITATASTTTFIERDATGAITHNGTGFTAGKIPLYTAAANASAVTSVLSYRAPHQWNGSRMILPSGRGFIVDQGADDLPIVQLKSSDIAHGMTTLNDTDTFGVLQKRQATFGGLLIEGYAETGDTIGLQLQSNITDGQTTKASNVYGGVLINSQKKSGTTVGPHAANENIAVLANNGTTLFIWDADGDLHATRRVAIGALGVSHAAGVGITINQAAETTEILTFKSSNVAHQMTNVTDTDTFGYFTRFNNTDGGLNMVGMADAGFQAVVIQGYTAGVPDTTKSATGVGIIRFVGGVRNLANTANPPANSNVISVEAQGGVTRFILDSDGDSHQDVGTLWTNFDIVRDIELLNVAAAHLTAPSDPLRASFGTWLAKDRAVLEKHRLVTFNEDGHHFVNWSRMSMLFLGALRQLGAQVEYMREQLNLPEHPSLKCLPSV